MNTVMAVSLFIPSGAMAVMASLFGEVTDWRPNMMNRELKSMLRASSMAYPPKTPRSREPGRSHAALNEACRKRQNSSRQQTKPIE